MSESTYAKNPKFLKKQHYGYHGTSPKCAKEIQSSQTINPSTNKGKQKQYLPWYGEGVYLYEDGIYPGAESARHYVLTIKNQSEVKVIKAEYEVTKLLDFTIKENFDFLLRTLIPRLAKTGRFSSEQIKKFTPRFLIELLKKTDSTIDAVRGASFEGEGIGMEVPLQGNLIIDVQLIICLVNPKSLRKIKIV